MRLFVAIDVSGETRAQVREVRHTLERQLAAVARPPRVTWVADAAAHVTIRFIGEVSDTTAEAIRAALSLPIAVEPYDLVFSGAGTFPNNRRPRVVWLGAGAGQEQTARVAAAVNERLDPILGRGEDRPFRAHLTVGRVKEPVPFDWEAALSTIARGSTVSHIDHVTLYRSTTAPEGPTYTALSVTPLDHARQRR